MPTSVESVIDAGPGRAWGSKRRHRADDVEQPTACLHGPLRFSRPARIECRTTVNLRRRQRRPIAALSQATGILRYLPRPRAGSPDH